MDTLLVNGEHYADSRGIPVKVLGDRELIQRALLRLTIKKGSFAEDPALGSELYKLRNGRAANLERMAMSYVQEALLSMPELLVAAVEIRRQTTDVITLGVTLEISQNRYRLEVDVV